MLKRYNKPEIAIIALAGFLFLAKYSYEQQPSYTQKQIADMNKLVEQVNTPKKAISLSAANKIMGAWSLSDKDLTVYIGSK